MSKPPLELQLSTGKPGREGGIPPSSPLAADTGAGGSAPTVDGGHIRHSTLPVRSAAGTGP